MKLLFLCLFLTSCSYFEKHDSKDPAPDARSEALKAKYDLIYEEVNNALDPATRWPGVNDCDATLWAGVACNVGFDTQISLAEYNPGEIHRRPYNACWTEENGDVGSKSTISKDMLLGYHMCLWKRKDLAALQRLADYGEKNDWVMGRPASLVSRVLLSGNGIGMLGRSIYVLSSGTDDRYYRRVGYLFPVVGEDFERHLQTQGILLQDSIDGGYSLTAINSEMLDRLLENANAFPTDSLFAAALGRFTGDQSKAITLLLEEKMSCASYARGENPEIYCKLLWLQAAGIVLDK
jgi:hypothetical protein